LIQKKGLIKLYFRELPDPLFTLKSFRPLIEANEIKDEKEKIRVVKEIIGEIPENNRIIIQKILELFNKIILKGEINKMNETNCATVLAPSVLYESKDPNLFVLTVNQVNEIFSFLIIHYEKIFLNALYVDDLAKQIYPLQIKSKEQEDDFSSLLHSTKILNLHLNKNLENLNLKISLKKGSKLAAKDRFFFFIYNYFNFLKLIFLFLFTFYISNGLRFSFFFFFFILLILFF
jgi:hypothetical protein